MKEFLKAIYSFSDSQENYDNYVEFSPEPQRYGI